MATSWNRYIKRALRLLVFPVFAIVLSISIMGSTHSWYFDSDSVQDNSITMGNIQLLADTVVYPLPAGTSAELSISVKSASTVDYYLRMGVTVSITDQAGDSLPVPIPDDLLELSVDEIHVSDQTTKLSPHSVANTTANGYDKQFITLLDTGNRLLVLPAGADSTVRGTLTVRYNTAKYPAYFNGSMGRLSLALVPEGVQATRSAVTALAAYGWSPEQVGQEGTFVQ